MRRKDREIPKEDALRAADKCCCCTKAMES